MPNLFLRVELLPSERLIRKHGPWSQSYKLPQHFVSSSIYCFVVVWLFLETSSEGTVAQLATRRRLNSRTLVHRQCHKKRILGFFFPQKRWFISVSIKVQFHLHLFKLPSGWTHRSFKLRNFYFKIYLKINERNVSLYLCFMWPWVNEHGGDQWILQFHKLSWL